VTEPAAAAARGELPRPTRLGEVRWRVATLDEVLLAGETPGG
jgi:predicted DNA-binding transcriptional regulator AlpA